MRALILFIAIAAIGCAPLEGLRETPAGDGPMVYIDWDAEPLPEVPFPNDLAARTDETSPTGLRLNFSREAPTQTERDLRTKADQETGFGIYAPIMVRFEAPLDLDDILARHGVGDADFTDDAVYVIDITEGSPSYLQPVELDIGGGRFPIDLPRDGMFWPNDPRDDQATLLFETIDEDLNGDGELQPAEDTDNDGVLDVPNTLPAGSTDRLDLIGWYERETDTLIARPAVPMREETTYAVVLTERLRGGAGPIRSPWEFVHHGRQTDALRPLLDALPPLGLSMDDVGFAWTFTTAAVTSDLLAVRNGLHGEGPFASLETDFPPDVFESLPMQDELGDRPTHRLAMSRVIGPLANSGIFPGGEDGVLAQAYLTYATDMVSGVFTTPNFLADTDDGGADATDEWWRVDQATGEMVVEPERVPFTCILPTPSAEHQAPFPVVMVGHGQGGTRFHLVVLAWAFNRLGMAVCGFDFPGHGGALPPDQEAEYAELIEGLGLLPAFRSFSDARHRDLDNDGLPDSGADFWVADPFHTRDNVRQAATDFSQFTRVIQACGSGRMNLVTDAGAVIRDVMSCDWDEDGVPDIGGPDTPIRLFGASLGGINSAVAAAIEPSIQAAVPMIPGGGLGDGLLRSSLGGPREAVIGRLLSPMILGFPQDDGTLRIDQMVASANNMRRLQIASLPAVPAGGRILVENLTTDERAEGYIPDDGRFRVAIAADAMTGGEKAAATGMPEWGPEVATVYSVPDNQGLGDRLRITIEDAAGTEIAAIDTFQEDVVHEGVTFAAGSPLVAGNSGSGHTRQTPRLRRLIQVMSMIGEAGDPIAYAPRWFHEPLAHGGGPANVLMMPTVGDDVVPIATGVALARSARLFPTREVDPRYGASVDNWLIDRGVVHGYEEFGVHTNAAGESILFDVEDWDDGINDAPSDDPLRATVATASGTSAVRIVYANPRGSHGWAIPEPESAFDVNTFATMQGAWYLASGGQEVSDDPCLATADCSWFRVLP